MPQGKTIKALYKNANLKAPEGKGEHTVAFHKCVIAVKTKSKGKVNPYAVCMSKLGRNKAVNKSHWRNK